MLHPKITKQMKMKKTLISVMKGRKMKMKMRVKFILQNHIILMKEMSIVEMKVRLEVVKRKV